MAAEPSEMLAFLNLLLECERAGAKALQHFQSQQPPPNLAEALPVLIKDEARYCAGLTRQITRLGGEPSRATGEFFDTILATKGWPERLDLLIRGQRWVAKRIAERLPEAKDADLVAFLTEMTETHWLNVAQAEDIVSALGSERKN